MSEQLFQSKNNIEYIKQPTDEEANARNIGKIALNLASVSIDLSHVERLPRYNPESRENDVEHSYMLTIIAQEIAYEYFPELDMALVLGFCVVHDLPEKITGDTVTFKISQEELNDKYKKDHEAAKLMCNNLPPHTASLLDEYEKQQKPEARFVRLLDKLMGPLVDIVGEGSKVMQEDRNVFTIDDLTEAENKLAERFRNMFPDEGLKVLHGTKEYLSQEFRKVFKPLSSTSSEHI
jgi:5'-deoxynucleotidase YfbR-like HD superfamily hydrolase